MLFSLSILGVALLLSYKKEDKKSEEAEVAEIPATFVARRLRLYRGFLHHVHA